MTWFHALVSTLRGEPAVRLVGRAEAERDIAAGILRLKTWGMPAPWRPRYAALLKKRLGVELQVVSGCIVYDRLKRDWEEYNSCMTQEIVRRFGPEALDEVLAESRKPTSK